MPKPSQSQAASRPLASTAATAPGPLGRVAVPLALAALALLLRLLFWQATADRAWPDSAAFQGDAHVWLRWADALRHGMPFEAGLPLRPPGAAYLIAALSGDGPLPIARLKLLWCGMAAATVGLVHASVRRTFGHGTALAVGTICAASTGWMILATSLDNETPYLFLVAATWWLWPTVSTTSRLTTLATWSMLHALACLVRAEHLLYFLCVLPCLAMARRWEGAQGWRPALATCAAAALVFAMALMPWHRHAWAAIHRLNEGPVEIEAGARQMQHEMERRLAGVSWRPEALAELERLPAVSRDTARLFISATHWVRGERIVTSPALAILTEAFGVIPRKLPAHPFVASYGGLNFALANDANASGGFERGPLDAPPPLTGGSDRYPLALVAGLPPASLSLAYPPHAHLLADGYRVGWDSIRADPARFAKLVARKLVIFWSGAALGFGGWNAPLGLSGVRAPVDLVVPARGWVATTWRMAVLVLVCIGAATGPRRRALAPWIAYLASKLVITAAFFGYARFGATVVPVIALLASRGCGALAARAAPRLTARVSRIRALPWVAVMFAFVVMSAEALRCRHAPVLYLDEREVTSTSPFPADDSHALLLRVAGSPAERGVR